MIEFNDIDFRPNRPEPMHHHHPKPEPWKPCPPPFDPELKRVFDLAAHADHVAHKALDVASYANLDATAAKKLTEQTLAVLNKVSKVANEANLKSDQALTKIDLLKDQAIAILAELNKTQKGAGLAEDGSYVKDDSTNYIKDATSLADADKKLDAALKEANDVITSLQEEVDALQEKVDEYEDQFEQISTIQGNIISAVGLKETGNYKKSTNSLINTADNVLKATEMLAEEITNLSQTVDDIQDATEELNDLQDQVNTNSTDIVNLKIKDRELQNSINTLTNTVGDIQNSDTRQNGRISDLENKIDSLNLVRRGDGLSYDLILNGQILGTISIPKDQFVSNVRYDSVNKKIIFTFADDNRIEVPVADLIDEYTAGNGISVSGNQISVVVSPSSEKNTNGVGFLTSIDNGIKIDGIKEEINAAYVAGNGLVRTGRIQDDPHIIFAVQVEENTKPYLTAQPTGLRLDVDALKAEIGGGSEIDYEAIENYLKQSPTFNTWIEDKIKESMLWQIKEDNDRYIEPKNGKYVYVDGEIEATGAIYSGEID